MFHKATVCVLTVLMAGAFVVGAGALPEGEIELVVDFDGDLNHYPEGVAVDKYGNIFLSMAHLGEIWKITPGGDISILYDGLDGSGLGVLGLAVDAPGNVYAAVASMNSSQGVYRISRDGTTCDRIPGTEGLPLPDGLAFDKRGNLYVTDAHDGAIYRVSRRGDTELWIQHPLLEGVGWIYGFPFIGANGIQYWKNSLIVANSEKFLIVRVPILPDGTAGEPEVVYDSFVSDLGLGWFIPDGIALDVFGNIYVADPAFSQIVFLSEDGTRAEPLATDETLLDNPTSLAFGTGKGDRKNLFIANFDLMDPAEEAEWVFLPVNFDGPSLVKMGAGRPGNPLP